MVAATSQSVQWSNKKLFDNLSSPSPTGLLLGGASRGAENHVRTTEKVELHSLSAVILDERAPEGGQDVPHGAAAPQRRQEALVQAEGS